MPNIPPKSIMMCVPWKHILRAQIMAKRKVVPGIEPGLPEGPDTIRIRSDNRYTTQPLRRLGHDPLQM
jgi:hypothetical protein